MNKYIDKKDYIKIKNLRKSLKLQGAKVGELPNWKEGKVIVNHLNRYLNKNKSTSKTYKTGITQLIHMDNKDISKILMLNNKAKKEKKLIRKVRRKRKREDRERKYRRPVDLQTENVALPSNKKDEKKKRKGKKGGSSTGGKKPPKNNNNNKSKRKNKSFSKLKERFNSKKSIKKIEQTKIGQKKSGGKGFIPPTKSESGVSFSKDEWEDIYVEEFGLNESINDEIDKVFESILDRPGVRDFVEKYLDAVSSGSEQWLAYWYEEDYKFFKDNEDEIMEAYRRG